MFFEQYFSYYYDQVGGQYVIVAPTIAENDGLYSFLENDYTIRFVNDVYDFDADGSTYLTVAPGRNVLENIQVIIDEIEWEEKFLDDLYLLVEYTDDKGNRESLDSRYPLPGFSRAQLIPDPSSPESPLYEGVRINISSSTLDENQGSDYVVAGITADYGSSSIWSGPPQYTATLVAGDGDNDNDKFRIDSTKEFIGLFYDTTHNLVLIDSADYESQNEYSVRLKTVDSNGIEAERSFTLIVNDINEDPTDIQLSGNLFDENISAGSSATSLVTTDQDSGDTHTYSLVTGDGDTDNSAFAIDGDELKIVDSPDFETQSSYSIRLQTTDSGGLTFEKSFEPKVNDLEEKSSSLFSVQDANALVAAQGKNISIPNGVASIDDWAFFSLWTLESVTFPDTLTAIGEGAFKGNYLKNLSLPESIKSIGAAAFAHNKLESVQIPNSITTIPFRAFTDNQLTRIIIPENITSIESEAFKGNDLHSVLIHKSVASIGKNAFDQLNLVQEGVHSSDYESVYAVHGQFSRDISFEMEGKNRFVDVNQDLRLEGDPSQDAVLDLHLTDSSNGDAFFLHDTFSDHPDSFSGSKDSFGRTYVPRVQNIRSIFSGDGDDLIDLTSTETRQVFGGVVKSGGGVQNVFGGKGDDVILGGDGNVFGEEGNDTLISHHSAILSGGSGKDIFGFLVSTELKNSVTGVIAEPVHSITDFVRGEDTIRFYLNDDLITGGATNTGNADHVTKTADGDIQWKYYDNGVNSKIMTVGMNGNPWEMDDLEFIAFTASVPELI